MKTLKIIQTIFMLLVIAFPANYLLAQEVSYDFEGDDITAGEDYDNDEEFMIAENRVMIYLTRSYDAVKQGHQHGLSDFAVWYRDYKQREDVAKNGVMEMLMKSFLTTAFNYVLPANIDSFTGKFLKSVGNSTLIKVNGVVFSSSTRNVDAVIDHLTLGQQSLLDSLALFPERYAAADEAHFPDAVWEIVDQGESSYSEGNDGLPNSARKFLKKDGVLAPSQQTINKVREETLTQLITTIYKNTYTAQGMSVGEFGNFDEEDEARIVAQRIIYGEE